MEENSISDFMVLNQGDYQSPFNKIWTETFDTFEEKRTKIMNLMLSKEDEEIKYNLTQAEAKQMLQ